MSILRHKRTTLDDLQQSEIIENLCYALCGFDTPNIFLEESVIPGMGVVPVIRVDGISESYIEPFKYLIQHVRVFSKKEESLVFIESYYKTICELKKTVNTIEELYIRINRYIRIFEDIEKSCNSNSDLIFINGESLNDEYNKIKNKTIKRHDSDFVEWVIRNNFVCRYFEELKFKKTVNYIEKWINHADTTNLIEEKNHNEFNLCLWKDKFKIKNIKGIDKLQLELIEECGKIVYFIRDVFKLEVINDDLVNEENEISNITKKKALKRTKLSENNNLRNENTEISENNISMDNDSIEDDISLERNLMFENNDNIINLENNDHLLYFKKLKPLDVLHDMIYKINQRNFELFYILNNLLYENISFEFDIMYSILFLQDFSFHLELFEEFQTDLVTENNSVILKINQFLSDRLLKNFSNYRSYIDKYSNIIKSDSLCNCLLSNVLFSEYVSKLLHASYSKNPSSYLKIIERLCYSINPGFLQYFLSAKIFTEIKIISRFLLLINMVIYYLEISPKYNFTRMLYLIFLRIKNHEIKKVHKNKNNKINREGDVLELIKNFEDQVYELLQLYYLTNINVFLRLSELIEIAIEYILIEYKTHIDPSEYEKRIKEILHLLIKEIRSTNREDYFCEFLERFDC